MEATACPDAADDWMIETDRPRVGILPSARSLWRQPCYRRGLGPGRETDLISGVCWSWNPARFVCSTHSGILMNTMNTFLNMWRCGRVLHVLLCLLCYFPGRVLMCSI